MKKILVPVDFSDFSMNALEVASYIAKVKEMTISLLHVMDDSYTSYYNMTGRSLAEEDSIGNINKELQLDLEAQLKKVADELKEKNLTVETKIIVGKPYKVIMEQVEEYQPDLVVMGSHGQSEVDEIFLGGTTEKIIRLSTVPVITVSDVRENYKIDRIVFASDFEEPKIESVLEKVISFAELFMAELFLVRVNAPSKLFSGKESRQRVDDLAKKFNLAAGSVTSYQDRSEEEGVVNYAKEVNADLIAMATHGRTGLARFLMGSVAEEVVGYSEIPVLTYNIAKEKVSKSEKAFARPKKIRIESSKRIGSSEE